MKSGLTVREDNYASVLDALKQLSGTDVLVGIPADKAEREDGAPYNNAELGYLHKTVKELHLIQERMKYMMETIKDIMYAGVVFASLWMFMAVLCQ